MNNTVNVIGGGLAGSEAALQLAKRGVKVNLYEMRPKKTTGAHVTGDFAEFVCSNSLGSFDVTNASGLLKKEMEVLGGELIECKTVDLFGNTRTAVVIKKVKNTPKIYPRMNSKIKKYPL